jgi:hypothetical protein
LNILKPAQQFMVTTILGGVVFLLPIVIILFMLGHALRLVRGFAAPLAHYMPFAAVAGIGALSLLACLILLAIAFLAGLLARSAVGRLVSSWAETSFLGNLPQYRLLKSMADGLAKIETVHGIKPALVSVEGGWQIAYFLEAVGPDWVAVFVPQAPTPMSGNVMYMPASSVRLLDVSITEAMTIVKHLGVGSSALLAGADLSAPAGA